MDKIAIVRGVALQLAEAEASIDQAIAKTCRLIDGLMTARGDMRVSTVLGGEAGDRLAAALAELMAARRETASAHGELSTVQAQLGMRRVNLSADPVGPLDKPPPPTGALETPHLAEVRSLRGA
ncbi:hypothetical protein BH09PSE2_BH09PSE2_06850 [soil metagenome]